MSLARLPRAVLLRWPCPCCQRSSAAQAGPPRSTTLVAAVVHIKTFINPDGTSVSNLGREREGSGIVIDENGLVLTIGYLMVEAHAAEIITNAGRTVPATVVGYDHETGFGLLRAIEPLEDQAARLRQVRRRQGAGPGAGRRASAAPTRCCRCTS